MRTNTTDLSFSVENILSDKFPAKRPRRHIHEEADADTEADTKADTDTDTKADAEADAADPNLERKRSRSDDSRTCQGVEKLPGVSVNGVGAALVGRDLWRRFHALGTEMIITKAGRRMFPSLKVTLSGLEPSKMYSVWLRIDPVDDKRYRYVYQSSKWVVAGQSEGGATPSTTSTPTTRSEEHDLVYVHPASPATGAAWMEQGPLTFDKLKLSNGRNTNANTNNVVRLNSMHRYCPKICVQRLHKDEDAEHDADADEQCVAVFDFPETVFTTVTAYQNQQITRLKIASNPFAKGFREATRSRSSPTLPSQQFIPWPTGSALPLLNQPYSQLHWPCESFLMHKSQSLMQPQWWSALTASSVCVPRHPQGFSEAPRWPGP